MFGQKQGKASGVYLTFIFTFFSLQMERKKKDSPSLAVCPNRVFPAVTQWGSLSVQAGAGAAVFPPPTHPRSRAPGPSLCPAEPSACAPRPPAATSGHQQVPAAPSSQGGSLCLCLTADAGCGDPWGRAPRVPRAASGGSGPAPRALGEPSPPQLGFRRPGRAVPAAGCAL